MRLFLIFALLIGQTTNALSVEEIRDVGWATIPICSEDLLARLPDGYAIDEYKGQPFDSECNLPQSRPLGHLYIVGDEPYASLRDGSSRAWSLNNLSADGLHARCVSQGFQNQPVVMGCSNAKGARKGFTAHSIASLHDNERELASVSARVFGSKSVPVVLETKFHVDLNPPPIFLGDHYTRIVLSQFKLRVVQIDVSDGTTISAFDYGANVLTDENSIRVEFMVPKTVLIRASLVFIPLKHLTSAGNGFNFENSADIKLLVDLNSLKISRGQIAPNLNTAIYSNDINSVRVIAARGDDLSTVDPEHGMKPITLARWLGRDEIVSVLRRHRATDNRDEIFASLRKLIKALQSGIDPEFVVKDAMKRRILLQDDLGPIAPDANDADDLDVMKFSVAVHHETEGCTPSDLSFALEGLSRKDDIVRGVNCVAENDSIGLLGAFVSKTSSSTFGAHLLETLRSDEQDQFLRQYSAHLISGAYGSGVYEGGFPIGDYFGRTARIKYDVNGRATIPRCDEINVCPTVVNVWFQERHEGDGYVTRVSVDQNGTTHVLAPGDTSEFDLSLGEIAISLNASRDYSHFGGDCCATLQQNHTVSIFVSDRLFIPARDSLLKATHAQYGEVVGKESRTLTAVRMRAIVSEVDWILYSLGLPAEEWLSTGRRTSISKLAQHHDRSSHPHTARYRDLYLRLVLLDALARDGSLKLSADDRRMIELAQRSLSAAARALYLPDTIALLDGVKAEAQALMLQDGAALIEAVARGTSNDLEPEELAALSQFLSSIAKQSGATPIAKRLLMELGTVSGSTNRSFVNGALSFYVTACRKELNRMKIANDAIANELAQYGSGEIGRSSYSTLTKLDAAPLH